MHILQYLCIMVFFYFYKLWVLILSLTLSGVSFISFGKLYFRHLFCKFMFNFECVYASKFQCIVIVDMCVRSY